MRLWDWEWRPVSADEVDMIKNRKRVLLCLMAAILVISLALTGCGRSDDGNEVSAGSKTDGAVASIDKDGGGSVSEDGSVVSDEDKVDGAEASDDAKSVDSGKAGSDRSAGDSGAVTESGKQGNAKGEGASKGSEELTCTISVRCDTILNNMSMLDSAKVDCVPANGVILGTTTVKFSSGESVFDVLNRTLREKRIHLEFVNTPMYDSVYIEGINNLYEFDCGELSGWLYKVNGVFPNYGCSKYLVKAGDRIEWVYTCDLGADVGSTV